MASVLMASSPAWATRDAMLPWSSFLVESAGLDDSGAVTVSGKQDSAGITSFRVQAFERTYEFRPKQLEKLKGVHANGMELLLSGGRMTLTGRMLTIRLSRGFAGDVVVGKAITIYDSGEITIDDMPSSAAQHGVARRTVAFGARSQVNAKALGRYDDRTNRSHHDPPSRDS